MRAGNPRIVSCVAGLRADAGSALRIQSLTNTATVTRASFTGSSASSRRPGLLELGGDLTAQLAVEDTPPALALAVHIGERTHPQAIRGAPIDARRPRSRNLLSPARRASRRPPQPRRPKRHHRRGRLVRLKLPSWHVGDIYANDTEGTARTAASADHILATSGLFSRGAANAGVARRLGVTPQDGAWPHIQNHHLTKLQSPRSAAWPPPVHPRRCAANLPTPWAGLWERINIGVFLNPGS